MAVTEVDADTLRLTSTGRSLLLPTDDEGGTAYGVVWTLSMVVVRQEAPSFRRLGRPGYIDLDGDLDLVLSDEPSQDAERVTPFIPTAELTDDENETRPFDVTAADVLGTGTAIPFIAQGWLWLPEGSLTGTEPSSDVFFNTPVYDGTQIIS